MWWTGKALGFDLETDGKYPEDARIITAALVAMTPGAAPDEAEVMLQPEREIPAEATGVHGITTERAMTEGTMREVGLAGIVASMAEVLGPDVPLVGHNASYDLTVIDREMRRTGIGRLKVSPDGSGWVRMVVGGDDVADFPVIDTYVLDKAVDRYRAGSRKLEAVARHYGVPMAEGSAHGATADVIAALRIAIAIANRTANGPVGDMSPAELHLAQRRWAAEQAAGLKAYFIKTGKTEEAATVDGSWPLRTLTDGVPPVETISTELV